MKPEINKLIKLLSETNDWTLSRYTLDHSCGIKLWYGNGLSFLSIYRYSEADIKFTWLEKFLLWPHVKRNVKYFNKQMRDELRRRLEGV